MRIVTDEKDKKEYKEFLEKHERCNFQQSPEWAKVKSNWKNEIVLAEDERKKIIGAVSILIRKIPLFGNIMYSSRGPTADIHDISVMKQLTDGIKELAKKYNLSISSLSHQFKKITGMSVMNYLLSCRIAGAKNLLAKTDLSIGEITELCGFSDNSNFSRTFKKLNGISPTRFRNSNRL